VYSATTHNYLIHREKNQYRKVYTAFNRSIKNKLSVHCFRISPNVVVVPLRLFLPLILLRFLLIILVIVVDVVTVVDY
jgi:hypothetical protein